MMEGALYNFLSGAVAFGFIVCGLFFLRYWHRTHDNLFVAFALAFGLLAAGQTIIALANIPTEERGSIYLIRLVAFAVILAAIVSKNRKAV
jgi:hypothetical protein